MRPAAHASLERGMTEAVIGRFLFGVPEDLVCFVDFLELGFGVGIVRVTVRVKVLCLAPVSLFYLFGRCSPGDPKNLVEIALGHISFPLEALRPARERLGARP